MAKRVRGACVYCGRPADTRDHAPPKTLLERKYPPNLFAVWACGPCNRGFARDEEYFIAVLSQIATAPTLSARIAEGGSVDRALTRSPGLDRRIINSLSVSDNGRVMLQPERDRVNRIVAKIAFGIFIRRYGVVPAPEEVQPIGLFPYNIDDQRPAGFFALVFTERFLPSRGRMFRRASSPI